MSNDVFNPFGVFDKKWSRKILPSILVGIVAFLFIISVLELLFPSVQNFIEENHIYKILIISFLLSSIPLVFYWLSSLTSNSNNNDQITLFENEEEAINSFLVRCEKSRIENIDICCYTGLTFLSFLNNINIKDTKSLKVRLLIRHHGAAFKLSTDRKRANNMKNRIITNINLSTQLLSNIKDLQIKGYSCEPSLRSLVTDNNEGFFSLYTTTERFTNGKMSLDYVTRGKPVFGFTGNEPVGENLMSTVKNRFDDMWNNALFIFPKPILIFDFDGTLFNSIKYHIKSWKTVLNEIGISSEEDCYKTAMNEIKLGRSSDDIVKSLHLKSTILTKKEIVNKKRDTYKKLILNQDCQLYPDVFNAITSLYNRGYKLAIATHAEKLLVEDVLAKNDLLSNFSIILGREDIMKLKPDPEIIKKICTLLEADVDKTVVIGDSPYDQEMANSIGAAFISIIRNQKADRYSAAIETKPFETIVSLNDLLKFFY